MRIRCYHNSKRRVMNVSSSFLSFQGAREYFPQYASQSGEVLGVLKQFLVEMNINIAAAEATELEHKKTFDELSDTKIEEIAASNQQHKEKNLKEQETKLSNDRNTTELKRTQESVRDQEAFLANLGQLDICEIQKIAEIMEISMRMNSMHAITSARRTFPFCLIRHARRITCRTAIESCRVGCYKNYSQKHWPCS